MKKTVLKQILQLHEEMKELVVSSGIQLPQYNFSVKKLEKRSIEYQQKLLEWFKEYRNNEYKKVKDLLDEYSGWEILNLMGNGFRPQILLRKKQKALRIAWYTWPRPTKEYRCHFCRNMHIIVYNVPDTKKPKIIRLICGRCLNE